MTSSEIQKEIITSCGIVIKQTILKEVKQVVIFSIIADEATHILTNEQVAVSIRYVEKLKRN